MELGQDNFENDGRSILEISFKFFFRTKSYSRIKDKIKQKTKQHVNLDLDLCSDMAHTLTSNQNMSSARTGKSNMDKRSVNGTDSRGMGRVDDGGEIWRHDSNSNFKEVSYHSQRRVKGNVIVRFWELGL